MPKLIFSLNPNMTRGHPCIPLQLCRLHTQITLKARNEILATTRSSQNPCWIVFYLEDGYKIRTCLVELAYPLLWPTATVQGNSVESSKHTAICLPWWDASTFNQFCLWLNSKMHLPRLWFFCELLYTFGCHKFWSGKELYSLVKLA